MTLYAISSITIQCVPYGISDLDGRESVVEIVRPPQRRVMPTAANWAINVHRQPIWSLGSLELNDMLPFVSIVTLPLHVEGFISGRAI
jgi:hypothetical protein